MVTEGDCLSRQMSQGTKASFSVETFLKVTGMKMKRRKVGGGRVIL